MTARPARVGLMIPSSNTMMEVDFARGLPPGAALHTARMYMQDTTQAGESRMLDEFALPAARDLGTARPDVVVFGCTSAGALRGSDYDAQLCERISELTGAPVVSTIGAVRTAIETSGAASIGVITPYVGELNEKIRDSIEADGIQVAGITGLGITDNFRIAEVAPDEIVAFAGPGARPAGRRGRHRPGLRLLHELRRDGRPPGHRRAARPARGDQQPGGAGRRRRPPADVMVAPAFEYVTAASYDEAVRLLAGARGEAKVLAGGQSLMPMLNLRLARPDLLIDINPADQRLPAPDGNNLRLPALTRHRVLLEDDLVRRGCPLLAEAGPVRRQRAGPQPGHDRRQPGARRSDLRDRLLRAGQRGPGRGARPGRRWTERPDGSGADRPGPGAPYRPPEPGRDPVRAGRQPVPVHRLHQDPRRHRGVRGSMTTRDLQPRTGPYRVVGTSPAHHDFVDKVKGSLLYATAPGRDRLPMTPERILALLDGRHL